MLSRKEAADWLKARGLKVSADYLRQTASKGPQYVTLGRTPYYRVGDLRAWLRSLPVAGGVSRAA